MAKKQAKTGAERAREAVQKTPDRKCGFTHDDGARCETPPLKDQRVCFFHSQDPEVVEKRRAAQQKGGDLGGRKRQYVEGTSIPITGLGDILGGLSEVIGNLKQMDQSVPTMNALIRAWQVAANCFLEQHDREQLEKEMNQLRKALGLVGEFGD